MSCSIDSVERILLDAKHAEKGSWAEYSRFTRRLCDLGLSTEEYSSAVRELIEEMNL